MRITAVGVAAVVLLSVFPEYVYAADATLPESVEDDRLYRQYEPYDTRPSIDGTEINRHTFMNNVNVISLDVGASVERIYGEAFINLHHLQSITVSPTNPNYTSYSNCLYDKKKTTLICFPQGLMGADIPDTVVEIAPYALKNKSSYLKKRVRQIVDRDKARKGTGANVDQ